MSGPFLNGSPFSLATVQRVLLKEMSGEISPIELSNSSSEVISRELSLMSSLGRVLNKDEKAGVRLKYCAREKHPIISRVIRNTDTREMDILVFASFFSLGGSA